MPQREPGQGLRRPRSQEPSEGLRAQFAPRQPQEHRFAEGLALFPKRDVYRTTRLMRLLIPALNPSTRDKRDLPLPRLSVGLATAVVPAHEAHRRGLQTSSLGCERERQTRCGYGFGGKTVWPPGPLPGDCVRARSEAQARVTRVFFLHTQDHGDYSLRVTEGM